MNSALSKTHKWIGVVIGVFILVLCVTGGVMLVHYMFGILDTSIPRKLHSSICLGIYGKYIVGVITSLLVIEIITGYWLWIYEAQGQVQLSRHRGKSFWDGICRSLKWNFPTKTWGMHVVAGFWCGIPLLIMALTGLILSFDCVANLIFNLFDPITDGQLYHLIGNLHTGGWSSTVSRIIWLIAVVLGATLPITGYIMVVKKYKFKKS